MGQWRTGLVNRRPFIHCLLAALVLTACGTARPGGPLEISYALLTANDGQPPGPGAFRVSGLSSAELSSLSSAKLTDDDWKSLLRVTVSGQDGPPMAGRYEVAADAVVFRPAFPLDPGRPYLVRFDPARLPTPRPDELVEKTIAMPAVAPGPLTFVTGLWPAADVWPENLLRFYIHFSAPMSRTTGVGRVHLEDEQGREIKDALLPLELDLWNGDYTRYTVLFDPGRVKRGILPNRELGRPLERGKRYAIVVDAGWRDGRGEPLKSAFRHVFTAGAEETRAIDPAKWAIAAPRAGTREALVVRFPWPLDRALLRSAVGVARSGATPFLRLAGEIEVDDGDRRWRFTPREAWTAGTYDLVALSVLEDPSGNAVGRPFEVDMVKKGSTPTVEDARIPFKVN
jgi:hypothetical protein